MQDVGGEHRLAILDRLLNANQSQYEVEDFGIDTGRWDMQNALRIGGVVWGGRLRGRPFCVLGLGRSDGFALLLRPEALTDQEANLSADRPLPLASEPKKLGAFLRRYGSGNYFEHPGRLPGEVVNHMLTHAISFREMGETDEKG